MIAHKKPSVLARYPKSFPPEAKHGMKPTDPSKNGRVAQHPDRWRPKETAYSRDEDHVGETLQLGEFVDARSLTVSEAALILNAIRDRRAKHGITMTYANGVAQQEIVDQGMEHARVFANYKGQENVEAVDGLLSTYTGLVMFERAQLGSLGCTSAEEAKILIPSLNSKIDDETLQSLLDQLESLRED
ncbi:hypothetical protein CONLIGDRAFT_482972 [Coniochaeta ligniaria NRRL 30616]|uniref:RNA polymerase Rpb4/RPC9 core domain-containing protein n=1 Tax=Coniochaeta ligniaria NRRL 30616 TaxID=1408157 RepID=A0A1J7IG68_9PEZI|nr:hypothetical protein CONLIGDRAFT_482972 [Coniochaeta ligniaria NRRL 30616]